MKRTERKSKHSLPLCRVLWPHQEDYHWQVQRMINNPDGPMPSYNPYQRDEDMSKLMDFLRTDTSMKDPLPVVRKTLWEFFWDYVRYGRWSRTKEFSIPLYRKPKII